MLVRESAVHYDAGAANNGYMSAGKGQDYTVLGSQGSYVMCSSGLCRVVWCCVV